MKNAPLLPPGCRHSYMTKRAEISFPDGRSIPQKIRQFFRDRQRACAGQVADALGVPLASVRPRLTDLTLAGLLRKTGDQTDYVCREQQPAAGLFETKSCYYEVVSDVPEQPNLFRYGSLDTENEICSGD